MSAWAVIGGLAWLASAPARATELQAEPEPVGIVNGEDVASCAWPSAVGLVSDEIHCSGVLVHPEVVLTAAHCVELLEGFPQTAVFGEDTLAPARAVEIIECVEHPDYQPSTNTTLAVQDVALCRLAEPVEDVRVIAPLLGCEADLLLDLPVTAVSVGFGADNGDPAAPSSGSGTKRFTTNPIISHDEQFGEVRLSGNSASGVCYGDSGGPGIVQLADGTFRVFGLASSIFLGPGADPCVGAQALYVLLGKRMAWFESESGFDLTPCHDADGTWNPDERCTEFPMTPYEGEAEWKDGCAKPDDLSDPIASCGPAFPFPEPGGSSSSSDGGEDGSSTSLADDSSTSSTTTSTDNEDDSSSEGTESGAPTEQGDTEGCGCSTTPRPGVPVFALALLLRSRRRRT